MATAISTRISLSSARSSEIFGPTELADWLRSDFKRLLPFRCAVALFGVMHSGGVTPTHLLPIDFPMGHLQGIRNKAGALESPLVSRWMLERKPFVYVPRSPPSLEDQERPWLRSFRDHGLVNAAVGGHFDAESSHASYFSFHGLPTLALPNAAELLMQWSLPLHEFMRDAIQLKNEWSPLPSWAALTRQEMTIAQAVGRGESNRDIAFRLNLREPTVKTHLSRIFKKTGLRNRCQLTVALKESPPEGLVGIRIIV